MIAPFNSDQRVIVTSPPKKTIRPTKKGGNLSGHLPSPKFSAFKFSAHYICQSEHLLILILSWEDKCTWSYFNGQSQRKRQIEIFCRGKQINTQFPYFSQKWPSQTFFLFYFFPSSSFGIMITRNVTETHLVGFLLELFDGSFIDSTAFVDQMASGSRFSRIYVTDDNDVDMNLFLCHCCALDLLLLDEMIWDTRSETWLLTLF